MAYWVFAYCLLYAGVTSIEYDPASQPNPPIAYCLLPTAYWLEKTPALLRSITNQRIGILLSEIIIDDRVAKVNYRSQ